MALANVYVASRVMNSVCDGFPASHHCLSGRIYSRFNYRPDHDGHIPATDAKKDELPLIDIRPIVFVFILVIFSADFVVEICSCAACRSRFSTKLGRSFDFVPFLPHIDRAGVY
jgi:hypothetical protein